MKCLWAGHNFFVNCGLDIPDLDLQFSKVWYWNIYIYYSLPSGKIIMLINALQVFLKEYQNQHA